MGGEDRSKHWHPAAPRAAGTSRGVRQPQLQRYRGLSFPAPPALRWAILPQDSSVPSKAPSSRSRGSRCVLGPHTAAPHSTGWAAFSRQPSRTGPDRAGPPGHPGPSASRRAALQRSHNALTKGGGADESPRGPLPSCRGCSALP